MTQEPPTRPLRVALVGTGAIAHAHAAAVAADPGAEVVAVADPAAEVRATFTERFGVPRTYPDLAALLAGEAGVDVVHLCTPPGLHRDQAVQALSAGAHVVCEKPPVLSLTELDDVLAAARAADRQYAVVFQQRTGTAVGHVQRLLASGELGRPLVGICHTLWYRKQEDYYAVPWRGRWATEGGGPLLGLGIHQLDLLAFLLGDWAEVDARAFRLDRDVETEDTSVATVRFANGAVVSVVTTALAPRQTSYVRVDTTTATVEVEHLYGHDASSWRLTPAPGRTGGEHPEAPASWALPADDEPSGHVPLLRAVYDALRSGGPLPPVAAEPYRSLELVTAIYASAALGRPVTPADLAPGSPLRDGFAHDGVEDLRALSTHRS
ncbi:Gfo/Idh/MocA family protein [Cellulomonas marina]|uniref:Predicted dehydrogenase n=1 Tax=Cellulomonas marina TaxID=988821 RepID=A0A1I0WR50_9CELL|nr:Gfo/Idh/MocA family oxidoreductase [Cellulomonas marina]GIG27829.1 oxidoreductase [Cellulomonas marina]SFA91239.1 Predicted dehydrogenase [Cellulomonas marina]